MMCPDQAPQISYAPSVNCGNIHTQLFAELRQLNWSPSDAFRLWVIDDTWHTSLCVWVCVWRLWSQNFFVRRTCCCYCLFWIYTTPTLLLRPPQQTRKLIWQVILLAWSCKPVWLPSSPPAWLLYTPSHFDQHTRQIARSHCWPTVTAASVWAQQCLVYACHCDLEQ